MERDHYPIALLTCATYTLMYKYTFATYVPIYFSAEKGEVLSLLLFMLLGVVTATFFPSPL